MVINENDVIQIRLRSKLENEKKLRQQIKDVHKHIEGFSLNEFTFELVARYVFYKIDGSIAAAKLDYTEALHNNFKYSLQLSLE